MKSTFLTVAALAVSLHSPPVQAAAQSRDVYHGVSIVDPVTETVTPDSYIVVMNGRIAEIGRGRPRPEAGTTFHDFTGLYALPGLIDTHAHVTLGPVRLVTDQGSPFLEATYPQEVLTHNARYLLSYGVTTIRDPGGDAAAARAYDEAVAAGMLQGPEALHAGEVIDSTPVPFRGLVTNPTPELPVSEIVRRQTEAGVDYIKLYENLSEADLREGIEAAHRQGLRAIGHLGDVSWTRAAELGIDALVHMMPASPDLLPAERRQAYLANRRPGGFKFFEWYEAADLDAPEIREMIAVLAQRQIHVDATLLAFEPAYRGDDEAYLDRDVALYHPAMLANWRSGFRFDAGWQADDYARARAVWPRVLELTRRMQAAGVPMTIGTDTANPFIAPGISVSREMKLHQQAGIASWAVLRMATSDAARILRLDDRIGRLSPGLEADIVFIAADPRPDLDRVADVRQLLNNGVLLSPEALRRGE